LFNHSTRYPNYGMNQFKKYVVCRPIFLLVFSLLVASMAKAFMNEYSTNHHQHRHRHNNNMPPLRSSLAQLIDEPIAWNAVVGEADRAFRRGMQVRYVLFDPLQRQFVCVCVCVCVRVCVCFVCFCLILTYRIVWIPTCYFTFSLTKNKNAIVI
jgi:hypothetical protein